VLRGSCGWSAQPATQVGTRASTPGRSRPLIDQWRETRALFSSCVRGLLPNSPVGGSVATRWMGSSSRARRDHHYSSSGLASFPEAGGLGRRPWTRPKASEAPHFVSGSSSWWSGKASGRKYLLGMAGTSADRPVEHRRVGRFYPRRRKTLLARPKKTRALDLTGKRRERDE
jgi:hypothetical protein